MKRNVFVIVWVVFVAFIVNSSAMASGLSDEATMLQLAIIDFEAIHQELYERCLKINPNGAQSFKKVTSEWGKKNYPALVELRLMLGSLGIAMGSSAQDSKMSKMMTEGLKAKFMDMPAEKFQETCSAQSAEKLTQHMDFVGLLAKYRARMPAKKENKPKHTINNIPASDSKTEERFIANSDGTVLDKKTNLMWAAKDNGSDINWANAKGYCENYRAGGYKDWRMPAQDELAGLYDPGKNQRAECSSFLLNSVATDLIHLTCFAIWACETRGSDAAVIDFLNGRRAWHQQSHTYENRVLPVRSIENRVVRSAECATLPPVNEEQKSLESLEERVEQYMQAQIDRKWDLAYTFLDSSSREDLTRDSYLNRTRKLSDTAFSIEEITMLPSGDQTTVKVKKDVSYNGFTYKGVSQTQRWVRKQ